MKRGTLETIRPPMPITLLPATQGQTTVQKTLAELPTDHVGHDLLTQIRIHQLAANLIAAQENNFDFLRVPTLYAGQGDEYIMEAIDDSCPIIPRTMYLTHDLHKELERFWFLMWSYGFAPYDYELFQQSDGRVMMTGFSRFGFRRPSGLSAPIDMPFAPFDTDHFFDARCFPANFQPAIVHEQQRLRIT